MLADHGEAASRAAAAAAADRLGARDFRRLAAFIQDYSGIKMPESKRTMVEGRLRKRVVATGAADLADYCARLFDGGGLADEAIHLIDVVTTNKTEFFREQEHFRILEEVALPELLARRRAGPYTSLKVWSTASSIGAEPYTLAMVLADASQRHGGFRVDIVATDISTRVLETAATAIYPEEMIAPVPPEMRQRYLLRSKDRARRLVRIVPELRRMVRFGRLNLMDATYPVDRDLDVIFCRNILIYFDKPTQQAVLARLCDHLRPGGYLFLGHSESLAGSGLPMRPLGASVFRRE
ncbi:chemotaxis protein methyltransferase CheR [Nitrospirillum amazonense]|uniref:Chemotaxis protein methyltransferase n=1 Tax=Nitrospirillum amazonense TaxID=28077 RepID=A0A560F0Y9_9PROT|nr:protein-glutamate O-methyltransferase [Nitrospirillum amazonense]TWB15276.1 chemotaxis protein methyltransferase CheR [Nitrospirillum amazonense]